MWRERVAEHTSQEGEHNGGLCWFVTGEITVTFYDKLLFSVFVQRYVSYYQAISPWSLLPLQYPENLTNSLREVSSTDPWWSQRHKQTLWKTAVWESKAVIPSEHTVQANTTGTEVLLQSVSGQWHKAYESICWHFPSQKYIFIGKTASPVQWDKNSAMYCVCCVAIVVVVLRLL